MARRESLLTVRANANERELIAAVAQRLERSEADTVRLLLRREAERLGISATNEQRQSQHETGVRT